MTKAKHTPGPWWADFDGENTFDGVEIQQVGRLHYVPVANVPVDYTDREEREANARLIAAAPDMYEALCKLEYWFDTDQEILDAMSDYDRRDHFEKLEMIRAAIAKAKG